MKYDIKKEEYDIGQIIVHAWKLFVEHFNDGLFIILATYFPLYLIISLLSNYFLPRTVNSLEMVILYLGITFLFTLVLGITAAMALYTLMGEAALGEKTSFKNAMLNGIKRWPAAVGTGFLLVIFLLGLLILLVVPALIFGLYWMFALIPVALFSESGLKALKHSKAVVKNRWWKTLGYAIIFAVMSGIVSIVFGVIQRVISIFSSFFLIEVIISTLVSIISVYFIAVYVVWFLNWDKFRVKK